MSNSNLLCTGKGQINLLYFSELTCKPEGQLHFAVPHRGGYSHYDMPTIVYGCRDLWLSENMSDREKKYSSSFVRPLVCLRKPQRLTFSLQNSSGVTVCHIGFPCSLGGVNFPPPLSMDIWFNFIPLFLQKHGDFGSRKIPLFSKAMDHAIDSKLPAFSMELQMSMGTRYDGLWRCRAQNTSSFIKITSSFLNHCFYYVKIAKKNNKQNRNKQKNKQTKKQNFRTVRSWIRKIWKYEKPFFSFVGQKCWAQQFLAPTI